MEARWFWDRIVFKGVRRLSDRPQIPLGWFHAIEVPHVVGRLVEVDIPDRRLPEGPFHPTGIYVPRQTDDCKLQKE